MRRPCASACSRDGHVEVDGWGGRRRREHVLRHARGGLEVAPGRLARREDARPRVRDGVRREPRRRVRRHGRERHGRRAAERGGAGAVAGDVGAIGCVQADARLERTRAFVKIQDGCSFSCAFCVIPLVRGATRSRRADAVLARDRAARRAGASRDRPDRRQPRLLSRPRGRLHAPAPRPRGRRAARASSACGSRRSRSTTSRTSSSRRCARRRRRRCTSTCPLQSGDDAVLRAMRRRYSAAQYVAKLEPLADFNLTADVIVGFPGEDEEAFARTLDVVERGRAHARPRLPVLAAARDGDRRRRHRCRPP